MKRVLHIIGGMDRGGAESFIMNAWRNIDHKKYQFDIVTFMKPRNGKKFAYEDELVAGGAKILCIKDNRIRAPRKFENDIANIVREGKYEIIHSHIDFMSTLSLAGAKKGGAKTLISHSHNTYNKNLDSKFKKIASTFLRLRLNRLATRRLACGEEAGKFLYGKNADFSVIPNGINISNFSFSQKYRDELRKKYGLKKHTKVILNVGRLEEVKNQAWLIRVFEAIFEKQPDSALFIIGDGSLHDALEAKIAHSSAKERIFLLASRADINKYYSLADIFALPSTFEGVPTVGIEAQASGLTCLFSTFVPQETKVLPESRFLPIDTRQPWKKAILSFSIPNSREVSGKYLVKFDIKNSAKKLEEIYDSF